MDPEPEAEGMLVEAVPEQPLSPTKVKLIKRQGYGRVIFDLLRRRVLDA